MDSALDPLDLVKHSKRIEKPALLAIDAEALAVYLEEIAQEAAKLINTDYRKEFLYKNPNGWGHNQLNSNKGKFVAKIGASSNSKRQLPIESTSSASFATTTSSSASEDKMKCKVEPWSLIENFKFPEVVTQINKFIQMWELSPATKYVVIALDKTESIPPLGERYFVEAHFSKPTPNCPNPLAVAKVYFQINVSQLLPHDYPVNVTYKFEGYKSQFHAVGEHKISSTRFQRYYIDSILHMKLSFYAELCECRHPLKALDRLKSI